jgi:ferredoxin
MKWTVRINPIRCRGHGICVLLFAEGVELDRWGYGRTLDVEFEGQRHLRQAHRAARACPNGAITVAVEPSDGGSL